MIFKLLLLELRSIRSDGRLLAMVALAMATLFLSTWIGAESQRMAAEGRAAAIETSRQQWEAIDGLSAHGVGHYGSYVYKPSSPLSTLDAGVMPFTGKVVRVEAHVQSPPSHSDAGSWSSLIRLGAFDAGMILSLLIPLLLAFSAFSSVSRDRETGLLRVLVAQGVPLRSILWGKSLAYWCLSLLLVGALIASHVVLDQISGGPLSSDIKTRLLLFGGSHSLYLLIVVLLSVWVSARVSDSRSALMILTIAWLMTSVVLPRVTAEFSSQLFPLKSQITFEDDMAEDRSKGLDGHNPRDERRNEVREQVLKEYGVEKVSDLPVNLGGILMQKDEEYGNLVWDEHFGRRHETVRKQIGVVQAVSFLDPFLAARGLSMAFAGTDQFHDAQFQRQAENYRRDLIRVLNDLDATAGTRRDNGRWNREKIDYATISDFEFESQSVGFALGHRWPEAASLLIWVLFSAALIQRGTDKIPIVGSSR
ncbi:MAG: hypothetical protein CBC13_08375 [Planctomycetia bacterium TMED53]|nr:MAG: hypothetical protein CBC13_08375 [Planctomycetia bacterium TMED53]